VELIFYFNAVFVQFFKTLIWFRMSLVRFSLKKRFGSDIIVTYYLRNSRVVNLQQILQH